MATKQRPAGDNTRNEKTLGQVSATFKQTESIFQYGQWSRVSDRSGTRAKRLPVATKHFYYALVMLKAPHKRA